MVLHVMDWPKAALTVGRSFGLKGGSLRLKHELRRTLGAFRIQPKCRVNDDDGRGCGAFQTDFEAIATATNRELALHRGLRVANGEYEAFGWDWRKLPPNDSNWHEHPITHKAHAGAALPWWRTKHLDPEFGDIKDLWEPSRFAWVYDLIRAYAASRDETFLRAFESHFSHWADANPPFFGAAWSCGQETAIRAIALRYAECTLGQLPGRTLDVWMRVRCTLAASGERIADAIDYAISQRNNHGLSEAVGLIILGERLCGLHPEAGRWIQKGWRLLPGLIDEQFAPDGWYIQHSFVYQRLALDQCVVAQRSLGKLGLSLSDTNTQRLRAATALLQSVMAPESGTVPNHGANDSSMIHPTTLASRLDFRPVITAVASVFDGEIPEDIQPDYETVAWLGTHRPKRSHPVANGTMVRRGLSGWVAVRHGRIGVFIRAGTYRSRPGHVDALHVDIRFGDQWTVVDPGTYRYNAAPPWRNGLAVASVHNGPLTGGRSPGVRGPRFLWYIWPDARVVQCEPSAEGVLIVAERKDVCRRTILISSSSVSVRDELVGGESKDRAPLCVRWLLHPTAKSEAIQMTEARTYYCARNDSILGWYSSYYGEREPTRWIEACSDGSPLQTLITDPRICADSV